MTSTLVYSLCAITSILCAVLLYINYRKSKTRMLFWSSICFFFLAINNILLVVDLVLTPNLDLSFIRTLPSALGFAALVWGFTWEQV